MVSNFLKLYSELHISMPTIFFVRHLVDFSQWSYNGRQISIFEAPIRSGRTTILQSYINELDNSNKTKGPHRTGTLNNWFLSLLYLSGYLNFKQDIVLNLFGWKLHFATLLLSIIDYQCIYSSIYTILFKSSNFCCEYIYRSPEFV